MVNYRIIPTAWQTGLTSAGNDIAWLLKNRIDIILAWYELTAAGEHTYLSGWNADFGTWKSTHALKAIIYKSIKLVDFIAMWEFNSICIYKEVAL